MGIVFHSKRGVFQQTIQPVAEHSLLYFSRRFVRRARLILRSQSKT